MAENRRTFILSSAAAGSLLAMGGLSFFQQRARGSSRNLLIGLGKDAFRHFEFDQHQRAQSIMTIFDLDRKTPIYKFLKTEEAHSIIPVGEGFLVISNRKEILLMNRTFDVTHVANAPHGYDFGGHGVYHQPSGEIIVSLRVDRDQSRVESGKLMRFRASDLQLIDMMETQGYDPHDMIWLTSENFLVCHYGITNQKEYNQFVNVKPSISVFSATTRKRIQHMDLPSFGTISHAAKGADGEMAAITATMLILNDGNRAVVKNSVQKQQFEISPLEIKEQRIAGPSTILKFGKGESDPMSLLNDPVKQRRAQSICYNEATQKYFVTFSFADYLGITSGQGVKYLSAFDLGLSHLRGVCTHPSSPYVFVSGQYRGVAVIDARDGSVVARHDVSWYDSTHLFFV